MPFTKTIPILRILDEAKAKQFYIEFLGFKLDWLASEPERVLERFGLVGDTSEMVDDAWEEVTGELSESLDASLRKLVYGRFMRDRDISEFAVG